MRIVPLGFLVSFVAFLCLSCQTLSNPSPSDDSSLSSFVKKEEAGLDRDVHEQILLVPVVVKGALFHNLTAEIPVTVFRPAGDGPFPLVILSHGRDVSEAARAQPLRQRMESAARYFVRKGFAVAVPTRIGYGVMAARGDPEQGLGMGANESYTDAVLTGATEVLMVAAWLQKEAWIDPNRLVLVGQSVGGIVTVACASLNPPGLVTAINFAGGHGGNPATHPGIPKAWESLQRDYSNYGKTTTVPTLWIYTANDQFFGPTCSALWNKAFAQGGGKSVFRLLPPFEDNGHYLFARGNDIWQPMVDEYLAKFGFATPGTLTPPAQTSFAAITDIDHIPFLTSSMRSGYQQFLSQKLPRAFVITSVGGWSWTSGDDAYSRALAYQSKRGHQGILYAFGNDIVWSPLSEVPNN